VCAASTRRRARRAIALRSASGISLSAASTSGAERQTRISRPGSSTDSSPSQGSVRIGVPQAAASNSRTLGDHPARTMSRRVTLSVNRCAL
jgi:hypothetical protein